METKENNFKLVGLKSEEKKELIKNLNIEELKETLKEELKLMETEKRFNSYTVRNRILILLQNSFKIPFNFKTFNEWKQLNKGVESGKGFQIVKPIINIDKETKEEILYGFKYITLWSEIHTYDK